MARRGDRRDLSRFIEIYREIMEAVDEAKASTRDQAWRWADGRMGGRGGRQDGRRARLKTLHRTKHGDGAMGRVARRGGCRHFFGGGV